MIRQEVMSPAFTKFHLDGPWPFEPVVHRFSDIDRGDCHDHPWGFASFVMHGGYVEEVYDPQRGLIGEVTRKPGDSFSIEATHIHRIIHLPEGECWTLILPGPWERVSRFWQFRDGAAWSRAWNETEWTRHEPDHLRRAVDAERVDA